jgi:hypothetical protein
MQARKLADGAFIGAIAVALFAALGHAAAGGASSSAAQYQYQGPPQDIVTGSGTVVDPEGGIREQFTVSAHSGEQGDDPSGYVILRSPFLNTPAKGRVTCMSVHGNRADVGGVFDDPVVYDNLAIHWFHWIIDDNGPPGTGAPDLITPFIFRSDTHPPDFDPCSIFLAPIFPLDQGNFEVKDGAG